MAAALKNEEGEWEGGASLGDDFQAVSLLLTGDHRLRKTWLPLLALPVTLACLASAPAFTGLIAAGILRRAFGGESVFSGGKAGLVQRDASKTAVLVAAVRYIGYREGWTNDSLSRYFIPPELAWAIDWTWAYNSCFQLSLKTLGYMMVRTLAGDYLIANLEPKQIVLLGAGLDTRAHRLALPEGTRVFEVDIATTQALKRRISEKHPKKFKGTVTYVPVDFSTESFMDKLREAPGFDIGCSETLILFEGVTMYLKWEALRETLNVVAKHLAPGTHVGMDILEDYFTTKEARKRRANWAGAKELAWFVRHLGEPFQWGIPPGTSAKECFQPLGFDLVLDATPTILDRIFFTPGSRTLQKQGRPIARMPGYGHYVILRVAPNEA